MAVVAGIVIAGWVMEVSGFCRVDWEQPAVSRQPVTTSTIRTQEGILMHVPYQADHKKVIFYPLPFIPAFGMGPD